MNTLVAVTIKGIVGAEASSVQKETQGHIMEKTISLIIGMGCVLPNVASRNICGHKKYKLQLSFKKAVKNLATIINKLGMNRKNQLHTQG